MRQTVLPTMIHGRLAATRSGSSARCFAPSGSRSDRRSGLRFGLPLTPESGGPSRHPAARHALTEIHPDYYQIPVADRQALIEADERAHREAEEESENRSNRRRPRHRSSRRRGNGERIQSEIVEHASPDTSLAAQSYEAQGREEGQEHAPEVVQNLHGEADQDHDHHHADAEDHERDHHEHAAHDHEHAHDEHDLLDHDHGDVQASETLAAVTLPDTAAVEASAAALDSTAEAHEAHAHNDHHEAYGHEDTIQTDQAPRAEDGGAAPSEHADGEAASDLGEQAAPSPGDQIQDDEDEADDAEEELVESVGGDDVLEEVPERAFRPRRQYKIQEVIKRRQVMLVQVVKEERGNKGAALTTYLSLAGRHAVLMPNTARGGGISRKIPSAQDRSRLKEVVQDLDVPDGMGIILRTAGASRTKPEIKRDFEYLIRMCETLRDMTLKPQAPTLVYEEGSLIKRSLRDLYTKQIDQILVAGEAGYQEARDVMKMLMPSNVRAVKQYRDAQPLFSRMAVRSHLDALFPPPCPF